MIKNSKINYQRKIANETRVSVRKILANYVNYAIKNVNEADVTQFFTTQTEKNLATREQRKIAKQLRKAFP